MYNNQNTVQLRCCENCNTYRSGDFKQVINLKKSGLVIYMHEDSTMPRRVKNDSRRSIILYNSGDLELKRFDYIVELCRYKTKCFRCSSLIQHVRSLLDDINIISKDQILGICEHCKRSNKRNKCKRCEYIVDKFIKKKSQESKDREERFLTWFHKVQRVLKSIIRGEVICKHNIWLDFESKMRLDNLLQHLKSSIPAKQPDIEIHPDMICLRTFDNNVTDSEQVLDELLMKLKSDNKINTVGEETPSSFTKSESTCICKYLKNEKIKRVSSPLFEPLQKNKYIENEKNKQISSPLLESLSKDIVKEKNKQIFSPSIEPLPKGKLLNNEKIKHTQSTLFELLPKQQLSSKSVLKDSIEGKALKSFSKDKPSTLPLITEKEKQATTKQYTDIIEKFVDSKERNISKQSDKTSEGRTESKNKYKRMISESQIETRINNKEVSKSEIENKNKILIESKIDSKTKESMEITKSRLESEYKKNREGEIEIKTKNKKNTKTELKTKNKKKSESEFGNNKKTKRRDTNFDIMLKLIKENEKRRRDSERRRKSMKNKPIKMPVIEDLPIVRRRIEIEKEDSESATECSDGDKLEVREMIKGNHILPYGYFCKDDDKNVLPLLFKIQVDCDVPLLNVGQSTSEKLSVIKETRRKSKSESVYPEAPGYFFYQLSNREFIEKGWTMLPTTKIMRRMNIYKMIPSHCEYDWFKSHMKQKILFYESGEKLAEVFENGCGKWFYENGDIALDYYNATDTMCGKRYIIYSSSEENVLNKNKPITVLACFDYLGNGVVYDHNGNVRLKYNQSEGLVMDKKVGPPGRWKWHTLNDPPDLQHVFINTKVKEDLRLQDYIKQPNIEQPNIEQPNEEMIAIELDNYVKQKATKMMQKFKPFEIKIKVLKINNNFSLRIMNQSNICLMYRCGRICLKQNIGMSLIHNEIIDSDVSDLADVSTPYDRQIARSSSVSDIQQILLETKKHAKLLEVGKA